MTLCKDVVGYQHFRGLSLQGREGKEFVKDLHCLYFCCENGACKIMGWPLEPKLDKQNFYRTPFCTYSEGIIVHGSNGFSVSCKGHFIVSHQAFTVFQ